MGRASRCGAHVRRGSLSPSSAAPRSARRWPTAAAPCSSTGTVGAWTGWAAGALALAVTGVVTLTRCGRSCPLPSSSPLPLRSAERLAAAILALAVPAVVAAVLVGSADTGRRYVQAVAYGDERRFPLRPPLGYLAATVVSWAVWVAAVVDGAARLGRGAASCSARSPRSSPARRRGCSRAAGTSSAGAGSSSCRPGSSSTTRSCSPRR